MWWTKIRYLCVAYLSKWLASLFFVLLPPVVSVTGLLQRDGRLLCVNLSYYPGLGLPGGLVEPGEEALAALVREVKEETGYTVSDATFLGTAAAAYRGIPSLSLVYTITVTGEPLASTEGNLEWHYPTTILNKLQYPNAQLAVKRFILKDTGV